MTFELVGLIVNPLEIVENLQKSFGNVLKGIKKEEKLIELTFFDDSILTIDMIVLEDLANRKNELKSTYLNIENVNKVTLLGIENQINFANIILKVKFPQTNDINKLNSMYNYLNNFCKNYKLLIIHSNGRIYNTDNKLVLDLNGKSELDSFFAGVETKAVIKEDNGFSDEDKIRINKNINILKSKEIIVNENMKLIPSKANTTEPTAVSMFYNLVSKFTLASIACSNFSNVELNDFILHMDQLYGLNSFINDETKIIIEKFKIQALGIDVNKLSWLYEECAIYLWMMGLTDFPSQSIECNTNEMNNYLYMNSNNNSFPILFETLLKGDDTPTLDLGKLKLKTYDEILEKADYLNRLKWAYEENKINNKPDNTNINPGILYNQLNAFYEILKWNPNKEI